MQEVGLDVNTLLQRISKKTAKQNFDSIFPLILMDFPPVTFSTFRHHI